MLIYFIIVFYLLCLMYAIFTYNKFGGMIRITQMQECILFCILPFIMLPVYIIHNIKYKIGEK